MKIKLLSLAFAAVMLSIFAACDSSTDNSSGDDLTDEEAAALLLTQIDANFQAVVTNTWNYAGFEPSADMESASKTEDGYDALSAILVGNGALLYFSPVLSFTIDGDVITPIVELFYDEDELVSLLIEYEDYTNNGMFSDDGGLTESIFGKESNFAQVRGTVAAGLAADALSTDDIVDDSTGELLFTFEQNDLSSKSYDDIVLSQRLLVKGNSNKIYIESSTGDLIIESTTVKYGVSQYRYTLVE